MVAMLEFQMALPEIIPGLPSDGMALCIAGVCGHMVSLRRESRRLGAPWAEDEAANFFIWAIVGILLGGRLAGTLIYEPTNYYWIKPWFIFWPSMSREPLSAFRACPITADSSDSSSPR